MILCFDTETTGLLPKNCGEPMPYILQLSFILYDVYENTIVEKFNQYVRVAEDVAISADVTRITGITREQCDTVGVPIADCLRAFRECYNRADLLVAHNIKFDMAMIRGEIQRHITPLFRDVAEGKDALSFIDMFKLDKPVFCTMMKSVKLCDIRPTPETKYPKYPKLSELWRKLFAEDLLPTTMHNSMTDVLVCLRCYLQLSETRAVSFAEFTSLMNEIQEVV
jgi:DNA polymerase III alpha subunit (gram-positive type)